MRNPQKYKVNYDQFVTSTMPGVYTHVKSIIDGMNSIYL